MKTFVRRMLTAGAAALVYACNSESPVSVTPGVIDFETFPDGAPACDYCALTNQFASRGVVFSFSPLTHCEFNDGKPKLFLSSSVYDEAGGPANHSVTAAGPPGAGGCSGIVHATFSGSPGTVTFRVRGNNDVRTYPVNAFDASGALIVPTGHIARRESTFTSVSGFLFREETITISTEAGIGRVDLVMNQFLVLLDNMLIMP
ncbi:MAG TPA: hypothetical protein VGQ48_04190 [Gemmatimonadales bacterium]|nr:hypothetical protein [Gemmatimonadales bacterium]